MDLSVAPAAFHHCLVLGLFGISRAAGAPRFL
jgi:hypothetical protein